MRWAVIEEDIATVGEGFTWSFPPAITPTIDGKVAQNTKRVL